MPVTLAEDEVEDAAAVGFAMIAGTADEIAKLILETDATDLIGTREVANANATGIDGTETVFVGGHDRLVEGAHHHSGIFATGIPR